MAILLASAVPALALAYAASAHPGWEADPTCDRYVLNAMLYSATLLAIAALVGQLLAKRAHRSVKGGSFAWPVAALAAILASALLRGWAVRLPRGRQLEKHAASAVYASAYGLVFAVVAAALELTGPDYVAVTAQTVAVLAVVAAVGWRFRETLARPGVRGKVLLGLLAFFLVELVALPAMVLLGMTGSWAYLALMAAGILAVSVMATLRAAKLADNAEKCKSPPGPDYPAEGTGVMASASNVFLRLAEARALGRRR